MFDFLAQAVDMRFYRMGADVGTIAPDFLQKFVFGNDFIFCLIQIFDYCHFFFGQFDGFMVTEIQNLTGDRTQFIAVEMQVAVS